MRALLTAVTAVLVALFLTACTGSAPPGTEDPTPAALTSTSVVPSPTNPPADAVCATAQTLVDAALPARAAQHVEQHAVTADCADEYAAARAATDAATELAGRAADLQESGDWQAAHDLADQALTLDAENPAALAVVDGTSVHLPAAHAGDTWDAWVVALTPLAQPALVLLGALAVLGLIARLLTPVVAGWPVLHRRQRALSGWVGLVVLVVSATALTWGLALVAGPPDDAGRLTLVLAVAGIMLACGVAGAVCVVTGWPWSPQHWGDPPRARSGRRRETTGPDGPVPTSGRPPGWKRLVWAGVVTSVAAAVATLALTVWWTVLLVGVSGSVLGVALVATWLATRLHVAVTATNSDGTASPTDAAHVAALVAELGATPGRGLEVPRGSDVTALQDAVGEVPGGKAAALVLRLARAVLGSTPWGVLVDTTSNGKLCVVVTRNGRQVESAAVDRDALRVGHTDLDRYDAAAATVDLHRFAAATLLVALARAYPEEFSGLGGARDWRSLGLHYVATTDLRRNPDARAFVLGVAVDLDPQNWLAQVTHRQVSYRQDDDVARLTAYSDWLTYVLDGVRAAGYHATAPGEQGGVLGADTEYPMLRLRALYTRAALAINLAFAQRNERRRRKGNPDLPVRFDRRQVEHVEQLMAALACALGIDEAERSAGRLGVVVPVGNARAHDRARDEIARLARELLAPAEALRLLVEDWQAGSRRAWPLAAKMQPGPVPVPLAWTTSTHYAWACYYATRPNPSWTDARKRLAFAIGSRPDLKEWFRRDPQLVDLVRRTDLMRVLVPPSPGTFLDVSALAPCRAALTAKKLDDPAVVARTSVLSIVSATGLSSQMAGRAVALAQVFVSLRQECPRQGAYVAEVVDWLARRDLGSLGKIRAMTVPDRERVAQEAATSVLQGAEPPRSPDPVTLTVDLRAWVLAV